MWHDPNKLLELSQTYFDENHVSFKIQRSLAVNNGIYVRLILSDPNEVF